MSATRAPIRCALLGTGMSTTVFHAPFILALPEYFKLHSVFERRATAASSVARDRYGSSIKVVTSFEDVVNDPEVDLVIVSTVNETHYDFTKRALLAGKHVIVEKPVTPSSEEALELSQLAASKSLILAIYHNRRYDGDFLTVRSLLQNGVFGEISEFESRLDRYKNIPAIKLWKELPQPGSGVTMDLGSHLIDQILFLFGRPQRVTALLRNSRLIGDNKVDDSFIIHLHYDATNLPNRRLPLQATARASILSLVTPQLRFTIKGTAASFVKSGVDCQEDQLKVDQTAPLHSGFGVEPSDNSGVLYSLDGGSKTIVSQAGNYTQYFVDVAKAIHQGDPSLLVIQPDEAILTMKIIELAMQSSLEGRTIEVPAE